jgi:hypothetical protein
MTPIAATARPQFAGVPSRRLAVLINVPSPQLQRDLSSSTSRDHPSAVFIMPTGFRCCASSQIADEIGPALRLNSTQLAHGGDFSGGNQSTFLVALLLSLEESCFAFGSVSALGVESLLPLNARPTSPNASRRLPAIMSQCGYSSARTSCPHIASTAPLGRGKV